MPPTAPDGQRRGRAGLFFEHLFGIAQQIRIVEDQQFTRVSHLDGTERLLHLVAETASAKLRIGLDLGSAKLAGDPPVRQIKTDREFGIALVDPVAEPHPAAGPGADIEAVAIDAFVEMRFRARGMRIFVACVQPISHHLLR
jgi:hypothetical protein